MCKALFVAFAWLSLALAATGAGAQGTVPDPQLREIRIDGNERIEDETIFSYLTLKAGDPFDPVRMDQSLKALFDTGLFADVTLQREGEALVVRVVENPIINRLAFEGNRKIDDEALLKEVQLRPRVVYTRTRVQNDVKRILEVYRRSGRFAATVEPKVVALSENRVDLIFEINEGEITAVRRISFVGNRVFDDSRLREVIQTVETRWWRILATEDTYDPDRLTVDRELLRRFYLANGYADFRVVSGVAELVPDEQGFFVTFTIEEGERYKFGKIGVSTQIRDVEPKTIEALLTVAEGDWYNADEVEATINAITDTVGTLGYAFVEVRPDITRNRESGTVDIQFNVQEGPRVFVERVNISGNSRSLDKVIRREFQLAEGDAFNTEKMRNSQQRLRNLGYFETVEVTNVPGSAPDKTVINTLVEEKSTGELSVGAGYSSTEGAIGDFGIRERNFLGRGQDVRVSFLLSQRTQEADLSFTEPYFLDRDLAAGFDVFRVSRDFEDESGFDQRSTGFVVRTGYSLVEPWSQVLRYGFSVDEIRNTLSRASPFILAEPNSTTTSFVGQDILYDRRDNRLDPTDGYFARLSTDFAGLGGSESYVRVGLDGGTYFPLGDEWTLSLTGESGYIFGIEDVVRFNDRFFLGGDSLRGFEIAGVGPRDANTGDALGGNWSYAGTAELSFPVGLPKELGILGKLFSDFGSVGDPDLSGPALLDQHSVRAAAGVGLGWRSPFGPVRVDYAKTILKEDFDREEAIRISFGTRF
ncbi:MAG: outer membrane protein assembly factor BamA [Alphaproteobacteria bacterium]